MTALLSTRQDIRGREKVREGYSPCQETRRSSMRRADPFFTGPSCSPGPGGRFRGQAAEKTPGAPFYRDVEDCRLARIAFPDRKETAPPSAFPVTGRWGKNRGPFPPEGARNALPEQELFYKEQKEPFFRLSLFFRASGQNAAPCLTRLPKFFPTFFQIFIATIFRSVYVVLKSEKAYVRTLCMQSEYSTTVVSGTGM